MKKIIRTISMVLSIVMAVTMLASCGKEGDGKKQTQLSASGQSWAELFGTKYVTERAEFEKENDPYDIPEELKGTTVKFATWIDHTTTEAKYAMETFEQKTGIKVEWISIPQSEYLSKLSSMIASGDSPDVYVENNEFFPMTLQISYPLDQIKSINIKDPIWDLGYKKFTTIGNHFYQINARNSVWQTFQLLFYNKQALEENGILTPQDYIDSGEWTTDNLLKVMREFDALGDSYRGGNFDPSIYAQAMDSSIVYMKDGKFVSGLKENALINAFKTFLSARDENYFGGDSSGLIKGTVGVYMVDTYGLKNSGYFKGVDSDLLGFAPIPTNNNNNSKLPSHYRAYGVLSGSKNPEAAGYFIRYFLDPYNYEWNEKTFISEDAKDFYVDMVRNYGEFENKKFNFTNCMTALLGYSGHEDIRKWSYALMRTSAPQLNTTIDSISNEVDSAVSKANKILDDLKSK